MRWLCVALLVFGCSPLVAQTPCPMCQKPIVPSRAVYAVFIAGGQTHRLTFRCIRCALHAAERWHPERALLRVRCAATGRWVAFRFNEHRWSAHPASARLLLAPEKGGECLDRHLVFSHPKAAHRFLRSHRSLASTPLLSIRQATESQPRKVGDAP
jgi:hypothetical protein